MKPIGLVSGGLMDIKGLKDIFIDDHYHIILASSDNLSQINVKHVIVEDSLTHQELRVGWHQDIVLLVGECGVFLDAPAGLRVNFENDVGTWRYLNTVFEFYDGSDGVPLHDRAIHIHVHLVFREVVMSNALAEKRVNIIKGFINPSIHLIDFIDLCQMVGSAIVDTFFNRILGLWSADL